MIYINDESYPIEFAKEAKLCPYIAIKYGKDSFIYKTAQFIEEFYKEFSFVFNFLKSDFKHSVKHK